MRTRRLTLPSSGLPTAAAHVDVELTSMVTYRRLDLLASTDLAICQHVFRKAPSFVYPTGGRPPTDAEVSEMLRRVPTGVSTADMHVYAIEDDGAPCGFYSVIRGYPNPQTAFLALLLLVEGSQGRSLGTKALKRIEVEARAWGCTTLSAAVDSKNERALHFWLGRGFVEEFRKAVPGFMGDAIGIRKHEL